MGRRVLMLRSKSPAGIEPRVEKEARALAGAGFDVSVVLWDRGREHGSAERRDGYDIERVRLRGSYGGPDLAIRLPLWWAACALRILRARPDIVHAVDVDTALPAAVTKRLRGHRLVIDVFDFYADMIALPLSPVVRSCIARLERRGLAAAGLVVLVGLARLVPLAPVPPARGGGGMNGPGGGPAARGA